MSGIRLLSSVTDARLKQLISRASRTGYSLGMHPNAKIHKISSTTWRQPTTSWLCSEISTVISEISKGGYEPYYTTPAPEPEPTRCKSMLLPW
jgi:hypothetical protein